MSKMDSRAQAIVDQLQGLPLWGAGRTTNLAWFLFGKQRTVTSHFSKQPQVIGEWALHIQCAWRLTSLSGIEVASQDMYYPASSEGKVDLLEFDWDRDGKNRCDEKFAVIWARESQNHFVVTNGHIGRFGILTLVLSNDWLLEAFPNSSLPHEAWRLFQPYADTEDVIFTGQGYES